jgi:1-deoxy-D-xylulose-5-phosphate reductoisomerase
VAVLGSTGSIGTQALEVIRANPNLRVVALAAGSRWETALRQARDFGASFLALENEHAASLAESSKTLWGLEDLVIASGPEGVVRAASLPGVDVALHAVPGFKGIRPLFASIETGKQVAAAGKEALVSAGDLLGPYIRDNRDKFIPVDSEHSAIFQCLSGEDYKAVQDLVLTASGGALRDWTLEDMRNVKPEDVLRHPTWSMGKKVTVDSATLFNKALEVIEAHFLFGVDYDRIRVVVHRESIVHSMVGFKDGATKAQLARADMRLAISYGLTYPERGEGPVESLWPYAGTLSFEEPDLERFPSLTLGYRAGRMGGTAPCVLSWADEIIVAEFLAGRIGFLEMYDVLAALLDEYDPKAVRGIETLDAERQWASFRVAELLNLRRR